MRHRGEEASPLFLEKGKEKPPKHADLANPENEHPLNEAGAQVVHFRSRLTHLPEQFHSQLPELFRQSAFETFFRHLDDRLLRVFPSFINQRYPQHDTPPILTRATRRPPRRESASADRGSAVSPSGTG